MNSKRIGIIILLIAIITPVGLIAQTGDSDSKSDSAGTVSEGFTLSLDLRTGLNIIGLVPGIPVIIGVPMSISPDSISITPQFGFLYYFDVMTELHNPYYLPLGISLFYNPMAVGVDILFYPAIGGANTNSILSAAVVSEVELLKSGRFSLLFGLKFGPAFIFEPSGTKVFAMVDCVFIPRFKL